MIRNPSSLKAKFLLMIGFLGLVPVLCVALNSYGLSLSKQAGAQMDTARQGAQYIEHINAMVFAAVMESRGIYMSPDWKTAEPYGKLLLQRLDEIETTANLWKARAIESERGRIEELSRSIAEFVSFRKELVRLAQTEGTAAGRLFGDNDANRKVRSTLNDKLLELDKAYVTHVEDAEQEVQRIETLNQCFLVGLAGLALAAVIAGFIFVIRGLARPLQSIRDAMLRLARGTLELDVPGIARSDEIGEMAGAVVIFRDAAVAKARLEAQAIEQRRQTEDQRRQAEELRRQSAQAQARAAEEQARALAVLADGLTRLTAGDLTCRLSEDIPETYRRIKDDFNSAIMGLRETINAIAASTREVSNASAEISTSTTDLSQRTEEQAASLEETAAAMEEISATVKKNAENAQHANQSAGRACQIAESGGQVVAQAVEAMSQIEGSSRKVSDIIGVIDEIARQTNLLALNAAVEAARAGEAGRGFAVVASEVRSLAQRSSQAAKDIKDLITNSSGQVQAGVDLVNKAGAALTEIVQSVKSVAAIVSDIASASAEQATGLEQVNKALAQMDEATQQNSALVEQNAATAKTLEDQSKAMNDRVGAFTIGDGPAADERSPQAAALRPPPGAPRPAAVARRVAGASAR